MVNLGVDTVVTVPDAPPAAGPDRALDPPPGPPLLAEPLLAAGGLLLAAAGLVLEVALAIP
jgi:hypothetical protein